MTRTSGYHDALGRLAQGGSYTGARLVRITALQGGNRYDARAVEFAEDGSTQFATEATFTVTNLAEPADQDGRVPDQTDAVALDVEGRWVVFVRPPTAGVFPARVVSALNNAVYAVREQAPGEDGSFVDKQGAPELNAQNLAELSLGPGAALEAGTIVLVTALTDEGPPPAVRYVFDHPAYAKYLD